MLGVVNGFSSGIQYLNENLFSYTERQFPTSFSEMKGNISTNIKTCAKMSSLLLNSSFGLAVAMGIVGLTTTSLCAGEDVLDLLTTTAMASTTLSTTAEPVTTVASTNALLINDTSITELVYLCFKKNITLMKENMMLYQWQPYGAGVCDHSPVEVDCEWIFNNTYTNSSVYSPESMDLGSNTLLEYSALFNDRESSYLSASALYRLDSANVKGLVRAVECVKEGVFYIANHTLGKIIQFSALKRGVCSSGSSEPVYNLDKFCFNESRLVSYYSEKAHDNHPYNPYKPLTTIAASLLSDECDSCNTMCFVFGVGSAVVLVATTVKILCQQRNIGRLNHSGVSGSKLRKAANIMLDDGLLLGAAGLGSTVLVSSLRDYCGPVEEDAKKIILASTVLYGASAGSKVLGALLGRKVPKRKLLDEIALTDISVHGGEGRGSGGALDDVMQVVKQREGVEVALMARYVSSELDKLIGSLLDSSSMDRADIPSEDVESGEGVAVGGALDVWQVRAEEDSDLDSPKMLSLETLV